MSLTYIVTMAGHAIIRPAIDIPDVSPDFSTGPARAGLQLTNQVLGICVIIAVAAAIVAGCLLAFAGLDARNKSKAWIALAVACAAAMVLGSITGMMTFFGNIPLF